MEMIHLTSQANWRRIKNSGFLLPKTNQNPHNIPLSQRVQQIVGRRTYLACLPQKNAPGWDRYGLKKHLIRKTTTQVTIQVPFDRHEDFFIRDHAHFSPKRFLDQHNINLFEEFQRGRVPIHDQRIINALHLYFESTIDLRDYKGNYLAEEIWASQKTPYIKLNKL